jgi:hypothetical protein
MDRLEYETSSLTVSRKDYNMSLTERSLELENENKDLHRSFINVVDLASTVLSWTLHVLRVGAVVGAYVWLGTYAAIATASFIALTAGFTWGQTELAEIKGAHVSKS